MLSFRKYQISSVGYWSQAYRTNVKEIIKKLNQKERRRVITKNLYFFFITYKTNFYFKYVKLDKINLILPEFSPQLFCYAAA